MGKKLLEYYEKVKEIGGPKAKIAFIKMTCLAVSQAETLPDTPELIEKFEKAYQEIKKQFS